MRKPLVLLERIDGEVIRKFMKKVLDKFILFGFKWSMMRSYAQMASETIF